MPPQRGGAWADPGKAIALWLGAGGFAPAMADSVPSTSQVDAGALAAEFEHGLGRVLKSAVQSQGVDGRACRPQGSGTRDRCGALALARLARDPGLESAARTASGSGGCVGATATGRVRGATARGESTARMKFAQTVVEPQDRSFRCVKALPTRELCLTCHGPREVLAGEIRDVLCRVYPQ